MDIQAIFGLQFLLSLVAWGITAGFVWSPRLAQMTKSKALLLLSLPHAFRHIGMSFLVPAMVAQPLPEGFAYGAAYGDLATGLLALLAIVALKLRWSIAVPLVWVFNLVGTADLMNALRHVDVAPRFGAVWFIPTILVPLLLVTHFMMFRRLVSRGKCLA
jgi:hypothetical protein